MKNFTFLVALMLFVVTGSYAQASTYGFAQSTGTYVPITGGTVITSTTDYATSLDSYVSSQLTLPTAFNFAGTSYTNFYVTSNGQISLGTTAPSGYTYTALYDSFGSNAVIAPFSGDLGAGAAGLSEIRWQQVGDEVVVQWANFRRYGKAESVNFQARLNTATGVIRFVYDGTPPYAVSTDYQPQVGIKSASGVYSAITVSPTGSWDTPVLLTAGLTASSRATFNGPVGFTSGLTYTWTPPTGGCAGTPVAGSIILTSQNVCASTTPATLTATGYTIGVTGLSFQWEESNDNGAADEWENVTGGSGATTASYTPPSFTGTTIYYRLKVTCTATGDKAYTASSVVNPPASPETGASAVLFTNVINTGMTIGWTNGSGNRRYVVINTANSFTDPVNGQTGPATASSTYAGGEQVVYDGTGTSVTVSGLTCNTTYYVRVYEYQRCGSSSPYSYYYTTSPAAASQITTQPATAAGLPVINDFTGFTGSNLNTVMPGWYEATGAAAPAGATSSWRSSSDLGTATAAVELYSDFKNEYIISPKMVINANSRVKFKAAITDYSSGSADAAGMQGTDDKVFVMVSTDACGLVWTPIYTFEASNTTTLTNVLTDYELPLTGYTGQTIQIAFKATEGTVNNTPDYDFHVANIVIENVPTCEAPSNVAVTSATFTSVNFAWEASTSNPTGGYQWEIRTSGEAGSGATGLVASGTTTAGVLTASHTGLIADTNYSIYVRSNCGGTDFSPWTQALPFLSGYCTPSSLNATTYIDDFSTTGLFTNIANNDSGYSGTGYQDNYDTMTVSGYIGGDVNFSLGFIGGSLGASIWIDWNNNLVFELSERVFNVGSYTSTSPQTGTIVIPAGTPNGDYRMRVVVDYNATNPSPCFSGANRAEAEDYKFRVITQPTDAVDYANLQSFVAGVTPAAVTSIQTCQGVDVYAQVYEPGVTEAEGQGAGITVWIGYRTENTDPATWPASAWVPATFNANAGNNDEYKRTIASLVAGTYYFASRVQLNGGPYRYGASNSGFYNETTNPNAELTVNAIPAVTATADTAICAGGSTTLAAESTNANYTYIWIPGDLEGATLSVSPASTTTYTVTGTDTVTGCTATATVTVVVNSLPVPIVIGSEVSVCSDAVTTLTITGGQETVSTKVGTGTAGNTTTTPFKGWYGGSKTQAIYTAAELTALGMDAGSLIKSIGYVVLSGTPVVLNDFTIKAGLTSSSSITTFSEDAGVTVLPATNYTATGVPGNLVFTLTAPIVWDGTSNLLIETCFNNNNGGAGSSNSLSVQSSTVASGLNIYLSQDSNATVCTNTTTPSTSTNRPNLLMSFEKEGAISWSPATNLYTDAAATVAYTGGNTATVYFKSSTAGTTAYTVTSTTDAGCVSSATTNVTVNVTAAPTVNTASPVFCNSATVADLADAATGTELKWYNAETGGTVLASDAALSTGTYYVSQTLNSCEGPRASVAVTVNVTSAPTIDNATQEICTSGTIADLDAEGEAILWYADETGGTALAANTVLVDAATYYASQTVAGCESAERTAVTVEIITVTADDVADVSICDSYVLPALVSGNYYTEANGAGTMLEAGDVITSTQTIYVFAQAGTIVTCTAETSFTVTITPTPEADDVEDVVACNSYVLPALTSGNYYTGTGGTGTMLTAGEVITESTTVYVYAESATTPNCTDENSFDITINSVAGLTGEAIQVISVEDAADATIEDLVVTGEEGAVINWFATEADAIAGEPVLEAGTQLVSGNTYYATQTVGECTSAVFSVEVSVVLGKKGFDIASFRYYPNPVKDVLTLTYSSDITSVAVFNMLGQQVLTKQVNAASGTLDMSSLADGTYILNVVAGNTVKTIKVVKKQ